MPFWGPSEKEKLLGVIDAEREKIQVNLPAMLNCNRELHHCARDIENAIQMYAVEIGCIFGGYDGFEDAKDKALSEDYKESFELFYNSLKKTVSGGIEFL
ncbi:MAG TPA: hypothetical protein VJJ82_00310 [Candidatus Nanoarchaeia archaeon]|nr:hypothetical protein [Candidatus Nanoarchaeia archaeon]